ncbi:hypothetical protein C7974DRAFT_80234 [Boeremia exigua]|uniref:uncharacterized protein n=1 Tax=Boeremia exigua TaxID=749465 RepID=UPI001E8E192F|nr:uncharacterized protein C7974DRAFT_80234 [Boeremia exigua]KAH6612556.1 hypothetical protein C7974DRAFT_80234 [Boeremia exigua]
MTGLSRFGRRTMLSSAGRGRFSRVGIKNQSARRLCRRRLAIGDSSSMFIVRDSCQSLISSILQQLCCHTVASRSPFLPAVAHIILEACHQLDAMLRWQSYSLLIGPQISPWARNCGGIGVRKAANFECTPSEPGNSIYDMLLRPPGTEDMGTNDQSSDAEEKVKAAALPL